ncbi:MAG: hypothetical protein ABIJ50_07700 [Pseudomonadota bacterium]
MQFFRNRYYLFFSLSLLLLMDTAATASVSLSGLPAFHNNGGFTVYQEEDGHWLKRGSLSFDEFFREKQMVLAPQKGAVHLRLVKEGQGVAHIDRVLLSGKSAVAVSGVADPAPLAKLADKDFDVVHFPEGEAAIEFTFSGGKELLLAARVEGVRLDETPFRFPVANLHQKMTSTSHFYNYSPAKEPTLIFNEATTPGTGHPSGTTSVLAQLQGEKLEIALDFEADNTLDGGKDYASVHVRQGKSVRTYTVSQNEQQWGTPYFTYTPDVPWQHKVYRFSLPLDELQAEAGKPLELAFSAYGTAGPGPYDPVPAYGSGNNEYLSVNYTYFDDNTSEIQSRTFSPEGAAVGGTLSITTKDLTSKTEPAAAYDPVNNRFLTLWVQSVGGVNMIHRQLVSAANAIVGNLETLTTATAQRYPAASFSTQSSRYLAIWDEEITGGWDIRGQMVRADNIAYGTTMEICAGSAAISPARLTYSPTDDTFQVVWGDNRNLATQGSDIYGRLVKADGTLFGISSSVSSGPGSQVSPDIAFDPDHSRSLVVWQDNRNSATSGEDIYGRFLGNGLMQQGNELVISTAAGDQWGPRVGYAGNGHFLVVWQDRATLPDYAIHGRWIDSNGEMLSGELAFVTLDGGQVSRPQLAGDGKGNFLSVFNFTSLAEGVQIGTKKIVAPSFSRLFLLSLPARLKSSHSE